MTDNKDLVGKYLLVGLPFEYDTYVMVCDTHEEMVSTWKDDFGSDPGVLFCKIYFTGELMEIEEKEKP